MRAISVLIFLFVFYGCNQVGLGVATAVKNFILTPIKAVGSVVTDHQFENNKEETLKQNEKLKCEEDMLSPETRKIKEALQKKLCKCEVWGNCKQDTCDCSILCPLGFNIFKRPANMTTKSLSKEENGLAFRNSLSMNTNYKMTAGYCWGHARLTSQFNRLAFFNSNQKPPANLNSSDLGVMKKSLDFYKKQIDKIANNQVAEFPGFKSLRDLSDHPALQTYIADKVATGWAEQAMSWQGLSTSLSSSQKSNSDYSEVFNDIKEKLDLNIQPTIVFTSRGSKFRTHAVLVSHYEKLNNGNLKLCIRDNNAPESNAAPCRDHMTIHPEKGLIYSRWGTIGGIKVAHNEKADANAQAISLREKCKSERGCGPN